MLNEQEEFELLELERSRAMSTAPTAPAPIVPTAQPVPTEQTAKPSFGQNFLTALTSPVTAGGPLAMFGRKGIEESNKLLEKGAYATGGAVTDVASAGGASPETAAKLGFAANVGVQAIPTILGAAAGESVVKPAAQGLGRIAMKQALHPAGRYQIGGATSKSAQAVQTLLDEGVNVTQGGVAKLRTAINSLNDDVVKMIASSPATVSKAEAAKQVIGTLNKFKNQVNGKADTKVILKSWDEFNKAFASKIPIAQAQAVKQGTYKVLGDKAYMGVQNVAGTEAQKAIARGLRIAIEKELPEIATLNSKEKALINALKMTEQRAGIAGNREMGGITWLANNPAAAAGFLADRSQAFKSIMARLFHNAIAPAAPTAGAVGGAMVGAASGQPP